MYTQSLILFSIILHLLYVCGEVKNKSNKYLPFVMVNHKGQLELPNQINKADINEILGFTGDVQFSKDNSEDQIFFCPLDSVIQLNQIKDANILINNSHSLQMEYGRNGISNNCLFRKIFKKEKALRCADDAIPKIDYSTLGELGAKNVQFCGAINNEGTLYKFVYEVCAPVEIFQQLKSYIPLQSDFEKLYTETHCYYEQYMVYEICYDHRKQTTIYTKHTLKSVNLLFDEQLYHEKEKKHSMMTDGFEFFGDDFQELQSMYYQDQILKTTASIKELPNEEELYFVKSPDKYVADKLVPPDDMITALLRKPTFHYINVQPIHQDLQKIWHYIEQLIRENFKNLKTEKEVEIYTGAFSSQKAKSIMSEDWPYGVPQLWIKLIYEKKDVSNNPSLVIIMKNENKFEEEEFRFKTGLKQLCADDYCKSFKQNEEVLDELGDLVNKIQCCPFNRVINFNFFNIQDLTFGDKLLQINNLTDREGKLYKAT